MFQKLQFLVRDWGFPCEIDYGGEGGQKLLDDILMVRKCLPFVNFPF